MTGYTAEVLRRVPRRDLVALLEVAAERQAALAREQAMAQARAQAKAGRRR